MSWGLGTALALALCCEKTGLSADLMAANKWSAPRRNCQDLPLPRTCAGHQAGRQLPGGSRIVPRIGAVACSFKLKKFEVFTVSFGGAALRIRTAVLRGQLVSHMWLRL